MTVIAPAKVNLHLAVKDKRQDGYHNLESLFLAVDFADILHFEPLSGENTTELSMEGMDFTIPMEKNIIYKAISLFRAKTGFSSSLKVRVEKRIPSGGGLGGGSSDAAAALLALNCLASCPLPPAALLELGCALGSDVPFFLRRTPAALVTGRGEIIEPVEAGELHLVLVNPGFQSDTPAAYRLLDEYRSKNTSHGATETRGKNQNSSFVNSFANCFNDFLPVFPEKERHVYESIIFSFKEQGAVYANLSGAGSTCFGIFEDRENAEKTAEIMRNTWKLAEYCRPAVFLPISM
jgi:4-diphosphocytidyl-2-C-methyl-D-erythritol kinase